MEYKKITVRVGRESIGRGIEFGTSPTENEDMLGEEEEPDRARTEVRFQMPLNDLEQMVERVNL